MKRIIIWSGVGVVIIGGLIAALLLSPSFSPDSDTLDTTANTTRDEPVNEAPAESQDETTAATGRYATYSDSAVNAEGYTTTVLFFHAPWCPECRAFESAIEASGVPEGVQILKVDYDSATELKQQHGVTIQTTFVSVDDEGTQISKWVGYGEDKSVEAILSNI